MDIIRGGITITDIQCEGIDRIEVRIDPDIGKRVHIFLEHGGRLAGHTNATELDHLIQALVCAREEMDRT